MFFDGTAFQLDADTHLAVQEIPRGAKETSDGALYRIISGAFRFIAGERATNGPIIDTPVGSIRSNGRAVGFGSLAFSALTLGLINELKAGSADLSLLNDETITYKDIKHGVFVVVTKEANPRVIVVDDPGVWVVLRPDGAPLVSNRLPTVRRKWRCCRPPTIKSLRPIHKEYRIPLFSSSSKERIQASMRTHNPNRRPAARAVRRRRTN